jgi:hypothetical protein
MHATQQYLAEVRKEYETGGPEVRSRLLDEAQKRTGYNRKYLIRALRRELRPELVKRGRRKRKAEYGAAVVTALVAVWDIFEQPCGQRMTAVLREQAERLRRSTDCRRLRNYQSRSDHCPAGCKGSRNPWPVYSGRPARESVVLRRLDRQQR